MSAALKVAQSEVGDAWTALEQQGNFSKSYGLQNGTPVLRTIYDPFSTVVGADGSITRTPFPNNTIPSNRFDPLGAAFMKDFWAPNNPGDNITGVNNYKFGYIDAWHYYNFGDRVDYNINDK